MTASEEIKFKLPATYLTHLTPQAKKTTNEPPKKDLKSPFTQSLPAKHSLVENTDIHNRNAPSSNPTDS